jgi:hypothetical protein
MAVTIRGAPQAVTFCFNHDTDAETAARRWADTWSRACFAHHLGKFDGGPGRERRRTSCPNREGVSQGTQSAALKPVRPCQTW